jgi:DUF971 family protein
MNTIPQLKQVDLRRQSRVLHLTYANGEEYSLPFEFLRVHSPSAEVKGHGPGQEVLQFGKENVMITGMEAAGNYAVQITFNDGHDSGIYAWTYLYELATQQEKLWKIYLEKLAAAGKSRQSDKPALSVVQTFDPSKKSH